MMPRGMSRQQLVGLARAVAAAMFEDKQRVTPSAIKRAESKAFRIVNLADPTIGTAHHPFAAYSHGVWALAAEGVDQALRAWTPVKKRR